ncbi:DUF1570 domain-containing protein [Paludisphaera soli]|uniref:DUF1570 domain-containing protein n=1 Tax=Paludisphaera soli TaxID=2712865 RepID=UPI0013EAA563|nr:DUF1570 domain-containing protein [Paludisphaera soli]
MDRPRKTPRTTDFQLAVRIAILAGLASAGCSTVAKRGPTLLPTSHQLKTGPFVLYSNDPISSDAPPVLALDRLRNDLAVRLNGGEEADPGPIEVYVLDDRNAFLHLLRFYFPELPPRRAFFLAQDEQRIVYTYRGPMLEEDLRHEAAHALLRGRFGDIPLWLDEGLAEYFEAGPDDLADRRRRLERLAADAKEGWRPDLRRLETLDEVHQMDPRDYRESWAWVDLLLSQPGRGTTLLVDHLKAPGGPRSASLAETLAARGTDASSLLTHLGAQPADVVARKPRDVDRSVERVVRMQDRPAEAARPIAEPRRAGLFRRIGVFLGL